MRVDAKHLDETPLDIATFIYEWRDVTKGVLQRREDRAILDLGMYRTRIGPARCLLVVQEKQGRIKIIDFRFRECGCESPKAMVARAAYLTRMKTDKKFREM